MPNQNPEQIARDEIDMQLLACRRLIQSKKNINLKARKGNSPCFIFETSNWNSGSLGIDKFRKNLIEKRQGAFNQRKKPIIADMLKLKLNNLKTFCRK